MKNLVKDTNERYTREIEFHRNLLGPFIISSFVGFQRHLKG